MKREIVLDGTVVNDETDCYVIAEIGHNHQGSVAKCKDLIRAAKECGANAVKLQKRNNKNLYTKAFFDSPYEHENSYGPTYGLHREALEFNKAQYQELVDYSKELKITFFATPFDFNSVDFLEDLQMPFYKIASADLINTPLLEYVAKTKKPIILSTGGGTLADVERAYALVKKSGNPLAILQCTASYPVMDYTQMNLRVIETYRSVFPEVVTGLSDHESSIQMAVCAYLLGGRIVEKHFTLNRALKGTDHAFSLEPKGFANVVRNLKRARLSLGDGVKKPFEDEKKPLVKMRKKIVAARDLEAGHILSFEDFAFKSPGDGILPYEYPKLVGKTLPAPIRQDEAFSAELL